jgi:hypothetical protein
MNYGNYGLNYNLNTGDVLSLTDVFSMTDSAIEQYFKEQTIKYINANPDMGWDNAVATVQGYSLNDFNYYIENDNIYLCYRQYELGAGYMGPVTVSCPIIHNNISVVLNGSTLSFDQQPLNTPEGRLLVPIRKIAESMNKTVSWDDNTKTASIYYDNKILVITLDKTAMYIESQTSHEKLAEIQLEVPATIINGRTLVPIRAFCESLGATVNWDSATNTAYITY